MKEEKDYQCWTIQIEFADSSGEIVKFASEFLRKEDSSVEEIEAYALELFQNKIRNLYPEIVVMPIPTIHVECVGRQTWAKNWFYHWTYNQFETDFDAERSFQQFLDDKGVELNYNSDPFGFYPTINRNSDYNAMGAEDRWRWQVCHCEDCKKNGITAINH